MQPFPKPRSFLHPKPSRLPRRKRVTLIVGMRTPSAIAMCADSQETIVKYDRRNNPYEVRVTVQKLTPVTAGKYQLAICGAGHSELIESFIEKAKRAVAEEDLVTNTQNNPAGIKAIHFRLEKELRQFYKEDVNLCQEPKTEKRFKLLIAAAFPLAQQYNLWISENATLREAFADRPELNGWDHEMYIETANRFFSKGITLSQAVLASIYTLTIAKNTCNSVRDPFSVAVVDASGIHMEDAIYIRAMEDRLQEYEAQMNRLFLSCADTTVSVPNLEDYLVQFKETALNLHRWQIDKQAETMNLTDLLERHPQRKLPQGPVYFSEKGRLTVEHNREKIEVARRRFEYTRILGGAGPVVVTVRCGKCNQTFDKEFANHKAAFGSNIECKFCGEPKTLREMGRGAPDDIRLKEPLKDPTQLGAQKSKPER
jgi:hypothetical protein